MTLDSYEYEIYISTVLNLTTEDSPNYSLYILHNSLGEFVFFFNHEAFKMIWWLTFQWQIILLTIYATTEHGNMTEI